MPGAGKRSASPHVPVVADVVFPTRNDIRKEGAVLAKEAIHEFDCRRRTKDFEWRKIAGVEIEPQQGKAREINDVIRIDGESGKPNSTCVGLIPMRAIL